MTQSTLSMSFSQGCLWLDSDSERALSDLPEVLWDERTKCWQAPAAAYRKIVLHCQKHQIELDDGALGYKKEAVSLDLKDSLTARDHQSKALAAWLKNQALGVVSLPTGAGKTILAVLAMARIRRPTLVVVPTIELLHQWHQVLSQHFSDTVGLLGGGERNCQPVTVATYDSAALMIEAIGHQFGFLVVDECHHLPAPQYERIALGSIAPFRLGLSATVERADGKEERIYELLGAKVYEGFIHEMQGAVLSPYKVRNIAVELSEREKHDYELARETYLAFVRRHRINFSSPRGWSEFVSKAARIPGGKKAMAAYRKQKTIAQGAEAKIRCVWKLLLEHQEDQIIIFTENNDLAYQLGRYFILPVISHKTKPKERRLILEAFKNREVNTVVTSKVLNEGVDVPEASVAIVVSGSAAVREHVQRLGRILRHRPGKQALLYELVARDTNEHYTNQRRRRHHAYQRSH